jgi:ABC-type Zn2+ transport system substrate-binding protein/surface adhesin
LSEECEVCCLDDEEDLLVDTPAAVSVRVLDADLGCVRNEGEEEEEEEEDDDEEDDDEEEEDDDDEEEEA